MLKRGSGILLHISSLPSKYGIGDFGPSARHFISFLKDSQQSYWQVLPFNPTDSVYGNSPYSSPSAFACNPLFLSPELLCEENLIEKKQIENHPNNSNRHVNYDAVYKYKMKLFSEAYKQFKTNDNDEQFQIFIKENSFWLHDYAMFVVLKSGFNGQAWNQWPSNIRRREADAIKEVKFKHADEIECVEFMQFCLFRQWLKLKDHCRQRGVEIIGDMPIYVNYDSADVWSHPELFDLDENLSLRHVAGVPPDYFSETGQRWGNPLYNWQALKECHYKWWIERIRHNLKNFDHLRIDHFRGFVGFWEIPAKDKTAKNGRWKKGPGDDFFNTINKSLPVASIIAEDLGIITQDVIDAMRKFHLPGMKVIQFAFSSDTKTHPYIPENYQTPCIAYTGTHDNNTTVGWYLHDATENEKKNLLKYLGKIERVDDLPWRFSQILMKSKADIVMIPMQDLLSLGNEARMNKPATVSGNWEWRLLDEECSFKISDKLKELTTATQRAGI